MRAAVIAHWRRSSDGNFLVVLWNFGILPFVLICAEAHKFKEQRFKVLATILEFKVFGVRYLLIPCSKQHASDNHATKTRLRNLKEKDTLKKQ